MTQTEKPQSYGYTHLYAAAITRWDDDGGAQASEQIKDAETRGAPRGITIDHHTKGIRREVVKPFSGYPVGYELDLSPDKLVDPDDQHEPSLVDRMSRRRHSRGEIDRRTNEGTIPA